MCRPDSNNSTAAAAAPSLKRRSSTSLLLTHESFVFPEGKDGDEAKERARNPHLHGLGGPSLPSTILTVAFYVGILFLMEHAARVVIAQYAHVDPVLEDERNRHILARHIGVDFVALLMCAYVAIANRHECAELIEHGLSYGKSDSMSDDGFEERVFRYRPAGQRLLVFFTCFQVKNMYDTIVWEDGIAYVFHHIFAGAAAW